MTPAGIFFLLQHGEEKSERGTMLHSERNALVNAILIEERASFRWLSFGPLIRQPMDKPCNSVSHVGMKTSKRRCVVINDGYLNQYVWNVTMSGQIAQRGSLSDIKLVCRAGLGGISKAPQHQISPPAQQRDCWAMTRDLCQISSHINNHAKPILQFILTFSIPQSKIQCGHVTDSIGLLCSDQTYYNGHGISFPLQTLKGYKNEDYKLQFTPDRKSRQIHQDQTTDAVPGAKETRVIIILY